MITWRAKSLQVISTISTLRMITIFWNKKSRKTILTSAFQAAVGLTSVLESKVIFCILHFFMVESQQCHRQPVQG